MKKAIEYHQTDTFKKNFKKLTKRFKTLPADLEVAKKSAIELFHKHEIDNHSIVFITGYHHRDCQVYKLRKFACRYLKGKGSRSGVRVIYAFHPKQCRITLIDIYFKADQACENKQCIDAFFHALC